MVAVVDQRIERGVVQRAAASARVPGGFVYRDRRAGTHERHGGRQAGKAGADHMNGAAHAPVNKQRRATPNLANLPIATGSVARSHPRAAMRSNKLR